MELSAQEKALFGGSKSTGDRPPNFRNGRYLLMIDKWCLFRGYRNVLSDIHNFVILKSDKITVKMDDKEVTETPNEPWTKAGATFKYDGPGAEMAPINSTRFLLALFGFSDTEISNEDKTEAWLRATNDDPKKYVNDYVLGADGQPLVTNGQKILIPATNPTRGMLIAMETAPIFTKKSQKWITALNFMHVARPGEGENSYPAAAARWAEYEARLRSGIATP